MLRHSVIDLIMVESVDLSDSITLQDHKIVLDQESCTLSIFAYRSNLFRTS